MAGNGEVVFEWAVGFVAECAAAGVELPPHVARMLPHVEVVLWIREQRTPPTWQQISERWNVCRATAFRWRRAMLAGQSSTPPMLDPMQLSASGWYQPLSARWPR
jgi:hypothetical protein